LQRAAVAADGEGHLGRLAAHAELREQPDELWIVPLVEHDEARVELESVMRDRVHVPAGPRVALEDLDVVSARDKVGSAQTRDSSSYNRYPHVEVELTFVRARIAVGRRW